MTISSSKRNLLFGRSSDHQVIRPPWAIQEDDFIDRCTRCGDCARECPSAIIKMADGGYPIVDFSGAGCDFCEQCVAVCEPEALKLSVERPFPLKAQIKEDCFAVRGVICRSCGDVCEQRAISFQLVVGGSARIQMNGESCNGCGECVSVCPANAIQMKRTEID